MSIYLILFLAGAVGIGATAMMGLGHGHGGQHGHGGHGHGHGHGLGGRGGRGARGGRHGRHGGGAEGTNVWSNLLLAISPIDIFSFAFGAGAFGLLFKNMVGGATLPWLALLGAVLFTYGIVKPIFALAAKFVSKPSEGIEGMVAKTGIAISKFDAQGRGLVKLILDDEEKQLLAVLDSSDIAQGTQIHRGDELLIVEVDPVKNSCRVAKI